jgi:archaellum biogenesis ATPase FlaH
VSWNITHLIQILVHEQKMKNHEWQHVTDLMFIHVTNDREETMHKFLNEIYKIEKKIGVIVIAVSNSTKNLDSVFTYTTQAMVLQEILSDMQWILEST